MMKNQNQNINEIHLNDNGKFFKTTVWELNDNSRTTDFAFGDADNDGDLDLAATKLSLTETNKVFLNKIDKMPSAFHYYPNDPSYGTIVTPQIPKKGTIQFDYTIYDDESDLVRVEFQYTIDNAAWRTAKQDAKFAHYDINNLATSPQGLKYQFYWETSEISKESNNVKFRLMIHPKSQKIGIYRYATVINTTNIFSYGEAPTTPTGFQVNDVTTNTIILHWDFNPIPESVLGYRLYINNTNSTTEFKLFRDLEDTNICKIMDLAENTSYLFKLLAYDTSYISSKMTAILTCNTLNEPPQIRPTWNIYKLSIIEDGSDKSTINLKDVFFDPTGDPIKFLPVESENFTLQIAPDGTTSISPKENWHGGETIIFQADDGQRSTPDEQLPQFQLEVSVTSVNDPPVLARAFGTVELKEDPLSPRILNLLNYFEDKADGDQLHFRAEGQNNIIVNIDNSGEAELMPKSNWNGLESFFIYANDSKSEIFDTITISVIPVEDKPVFNMPNSVKWITGGWENLTINATDDDKSDLLEFSTNIEELFPKLVLGETYSFNVLTGELSVSVKNYMIGTYPLSLSVSDGKNTVTRNITLLIEKNENDISTDPISKEKEELNIMNIVILVIIVLVILLIVVFFVINRRKKSLGISFIKCPNCGKTMAKKGKSGFVCTACDTEIDSINVAGQVQVPQPAVTPSQPTLQQSMDSAYGTKVDGGRYTKSILDGSLLDEIASEVDTDSIDAPDQIPKATPITEVPPPPQAAPTPALPAPTAPTSSTEVAPPPSPRPAPVPAPIPAPAPVPALPAPTSEPVSEPLPSPAPVPEPAPEPAPETTPATPTAPLAEPPATVVEEQFLCPNCNTSLTRDMSNCPGCNAPLNFD
jgi:hypothetical protein